MAKREYKSISQHLGQFSSPRTKMTYLSGIGGFFRFINPDVKDLDAYSISYLKSHSQSQIESDIVKFRDSMLTRVAKTRTGYLKSTLGFFDANDVTFKRNWKNNIIGKDTTAVSEESIPTQQELERILNFMPLIGKAITLFLCSSGVRVGELLQLKESNIDLTKNPVMVTLPASITKTKKKRVTFISMEAKKMLQEWLEYKPKWLETTSTKSPTPFDTTRIFPLTDNGYRELWDRAVEKAKLAEKDQTTNRLQRRIHALRKFFRTYGKWQQPDIAEALMGHLGGIEEIYTRFTENQLREAYLTAEPNLTIVGSAPNLKELEAKVEARYQGVDKLIADLSIKNQRLENIIQKRDTEYKEMMEIALKPYLETFSTLKDRVDAQELEIDNMRKAGELRDQEEVLKIIPAELKIKKDEV
ncbi:MAG: site-specific integrase [Candidatus Bathyarchaeia archaeon]|jgi:integrase